MLAIVADAVSAHVVVLLFTLQKQQQQQQHRQVKTQTKNYGGHKAPDKGKKPNDQSQRELRQATKDMETTKVGETKTATINEAT